MKTQEEARETLNTLFAIGKRVKLVATITNSEKASQILSIVLQDREDAVQPVGGYEITAVELNLNYEEEQKEFSKDLAALFKKHANFLELYNLR